ncbi:MAG TPA: acyl-ACP thioesterase domain-containing protein [Bacteroidales bacterium]|nr:acyl-ACP thioesterase domain-containing protein [Bacteroidales bacterium]
MEIIELEKEYRVHVYETGPDERLTIHSLFNYMQDIASEHAIKLGFGRDDLMKANRFWVLSRMYTEFTTWPLWGDTIIVKTWPNGTDKLFALRNYEVTFPDGRHIASGSSSWLILDYATRRIQRPDAILEKFYRDLDPNETPVRYATKLDHKSGEWKVSDPFRVKTGDLDVNFHTNNTRYLNWIYNSYDMEFLVNNSPGSAEINYLAESVYNDEIIIKTSPDIDDPTYQNHSVVRSEDNRELCRVRIEWKPNAVN